MFKNSSDLSQLFAGTMDTYMMMLAQIKSYFQEQRTECFLAGHFLTFYVYFYHSHMPGAQFPFSPLQLNP